MRIKLILDPSAGGGKGRRFFPQIRKILGKGNLLDFSFTKGPGDAVLLTQESVRKKYDIIVGGCGDGTLNEIINGMLQSGNGLPLGFIPLGMSNTAAWSLGIPQDPVKAAEMVLQGKIRKIDLGRVVKPISHYFISMADYGYPGALVHGSEPKFNPNMFWLKLKLKKLLYWMQGYPVLIAYKFPRLVVKADEVETEGIGIICSNNGNYMGKFKVAREARIDDGYLDVCVLKKSGRLNMQRYFFIGILLGKMHTFSDVEYYRAKKVSITSSESVPGQIDGDAFGFTPVEMEIAPQILPVIVS